MIYGLSFSVWVSPGENSKSPPWVYFLAIYMKHSLTVGTQVTIPRQLSFSLSDTLYLTLQVSIDWTPQSAIG